MGAATIEYPGVVRIAADTPHLKAGGTDAFAAPRLWPQWMAGVEPFTTAKLRRAHRHGGAIPWSWIKERANPVSYVLPNPTATDAHYLTEVAGHAASSPPNWPTSPDWWAYDVRRKLDGLTYTYNTVPVPPTVVATPKPILSAYVVATDAEKIVMMLKPEPPTLSADDWFYLDPVGQYHQFSGPAGAAAVGHMERMTLLRPATTGLNIRTTGAQCQYVCRLLAGSSTAVSAASYGATWNGTDWIIDVKYGTAFSWDYTRAGMLHGWAYAAEIDPETGRVAAAYSLPEGSALNVRLRGAFDISAESPTAMAITWPTGIRKLSGRYNNTPTANTPRLVWRPAKPWRAVVTVDGYTYKWLNVNASAVGLATVMGTPTIADLFRGYYASESAASEASTGDWKTLCTFPAWAGGDLGAPTWGATLPTAGQEIIVTAWHDTMHGGGGMSDSQILIYLYPEATVSPVAIPVALGGVIQGGTP